MFIVDWSAIAAGSRDGFLIKFGLFSEPLSKDCILRNDPVAVKKRIHSGVGADVWCRVGTVVVKARTTGNRGALRLREDVPALLKALPLGDFACRSKSLTGPSWAKSYAVLPSYRVAGITTGIREVTNGNER